MIADKRDLTIWADRRKLKSGGGGGGGTVLYGLSCSFDSSVGSKEMFQLN